LRWESLRDSHISTARPLLHDIFSKKIIPKGAFTQLIHDADRYFIGAANFLELSVVIEGQTAPDASHQCDVFPAEPTSSSNLSPSGRRIFLDFGKGRQAVGLNSGDCFPYALAKIIAEPLLKGKISKRPRSHPLSQREVR